MANANFSGAVSVTDACAEQLWNEQQLAEPVREPAWRVWAYREPAIVLGCSQRRLLAAARDDIDLALLLRSSGGGAVLAGPWMLGLSVVLPAQHTLAQAGLLVSYRWLGELLATLLRQAGMAARALPAKAVRERAPQASLAWACFGGLSPCEIVVGERKIAGLAQVRRRHGVLCVAGLLLHKPDWLLLCRPFGYGAETAAALASVTTSWAQECGAWPETTAVVAALEEQLGAALHTPSRAVQARSLSNHSPPSRAAIAV